MPFIPVDTAIQITVGPLVDDTDFKSLETGVAYNAAGMAVDLIEKGVNTSTKTDITPTTAGANDWVELGNGMYSLEITAAQNATEGTLQAVGVVTGILPFASPVYTVVPTKIYNSLVAGSDNLEVDATLIEGIDATDQINAAVDAALDTPIPAATSGSINERLKTMDDADIPARLPAALVGGRMDSDVAVLQAGVIDANAVAVGAIDAAALSVDAGQEIADAVWDEPLTEPTAIWTWGSATPRKLIAWLGALARNKMTQTATVQTLRDDADAATIATAGVSDDGTTFTRGEWA